MTKCDLFSSMNIESNAQSMKLRDRANSCINLAPQSVAWWTCHLREPWQRCQQRCGVPASIPQIAGESAPVRGEYRRPSRKIRWNRRVRKDGCKSKAVNARKRLTFCEWTNHQIHCSTILAIFLGLNVRIHLHAIQPPPQVSILLAQLIQFFPSYGEVRR
jgi:hypothetical protein